MPQKASEGRNHCPKFVVVGVGGEVVVGLLVEWKTGSWGHALQSLGRQIHSR